MSGRNTPAGAAMRSPRHRPQPCRRRAGGPPPACWRICWGDDTPVPVLEPGLGRTRTGRLWVYVRDDRPFCGLARPAAAYFYSPDRGAEHPARHLAGCAGFLQADAQADAYAGFEALYDQRRRAPGITAITAVACWSHSRRNIFRVWETTKSPVAKAGLDQIALIYAIADKARFAPPAERVAHRAATIPLLNAFFAWAETTEHKLSARSALAEALRYIIKRRTALTRFATDPRLATPGSKRTTTSPKTPSAVLPSEDAIGYSPAATPAASAPPPCTRSCRPQN
jgi:transposase